MNNISTLQDVQARENTLLRNVYLYLIGGLALTAIVSYALSQSESLMRAIVLNPIAMLVVVIAQFAVVMVISGRTESMKASTAVLTFFLYAILTGVTFSVIFIAYAPTAITKAFISTASVFAGASIYGAFSKKNVRSWGRYLFMALFGLVIASMLNMFFYSSTFDFMISLVGVGLFTVLTIWDTNKIVAMNREFGGYISQADYTKLGILGALDLYLDFINIFLYLVRIFAHGNRD